MSPDAQRLPPELDALLTRIECALNTAEGMAMMIEDNEPADPTAHQRPGYNVHKITLAMMVLSQHGRQLLQDLRQQYAKQTLH